MVSIDSDTDDRMVETDSLHKSSAGTKDTANRFRLLIIGKSGCGKTTILSKVCGEEVADKPSTTRGTHNIEREMQFKNNAQFIVHDSEGFEAGQDDEFKVVTNFINSRGRTRPLNERLHAIWYCLTTSSRPIQQAEETFFSEKHDVPVVAIFTKFDLFIETQLQDLMEAEADDDLDEEKESQLEQQAKTIALKKFEDHFKGALLARRHPPQAVVALSDVHSSTLSDPRLGELIRATSNALRLDSKDGSTDEQKEALHLAALFAAAQQADLLHKYEWSIRQGTPYILTEANARESADKWRRELVEQWSQKWHEDPQVLLAAFAEHLEGHPEILGTQTTPSYRLGKELSSKEIEAYRCLQLAAHLTTIMAQIYLLTIEDDPGMLTIVRKYTNTTAFKYIQDHILDVDIWEVFEDDDDEEMKGFRLFRYLIREPVGKIIDAAVRTLMQA